MSTVIFTFPMTQIHMEKETFVEQFNIDVMETGPNNLIGTCFTKWFGNRQELVRTSQPEDPFDL